MSEARVLLPEPDGPTTASIWPGPTSMSMSWSTMRPGSPGTVSVSREATEVSLAAGYRNDTPFSARCPWTGCGSTASGASATGLGASSTSNTRSKETNADMTSTRALVSWASGP